jgi:hypothetical protein
MPSSSLETSPSEACRLTHLLELYRQKRAVDGRCGRDWDGSEHYRLDQEIERVEAQAAAAGAVVVARNRTTGEVFGYWSAGWVWHDGAPPAGR